MRLLTALLVLAVFTVGFGLGGMIALSFPGDQPILQTQTILHRGLTTETTQVAGTTETALTAEKSKAEELVYPQEQDSPYDWIKEEQIHMGVSKVCFDMPVGYEAYWSAYADTNSMDPVFDAGSNGIQLVPQSISDVHVGDVISYDYPSYGTIIHRVAEIGYDDDGWYCIVKGDNNRYPDPGKVRFDQIKKVLVAVIY